MVRLLLYLMQLYYGGPNKLIPVFDEFLYTAASRYVVFLDWTLVRLWLWTVFPSLFVDVVSNSYLSKFSMNSLSLYVTNNLSVGEISELKSISWL